VRNQIARTMIARLVRKTARAIPTLSPELRDDNEDGAEDRVGVETAIVD